MKRLLPVALFAGLLSCSSRPAEAKQIQCEDLPIVFSIIRDTHYSGRELAEQVPKRAVDLFVKGLDGSRSLLLVADVERLHRELPAAFEQVRAGQCVLLTKAFADVVARAEQDEKTVKTVLGAPDFKLDESVELVLDPEKRGWMTTPEQREQLLVKMIHFQLSSYLASGLEMGPAKKQLTHRYELITKRLKERLESNRALEMFAEAYAASFDPHTAFLGAETLEDFQISMRLSLEGIGAALRSEDGFAVIESLIPGGSAERSKMLQPKDKIIAVAQDGEKPVPVIDMDLKDVVRQIRGKKGTKVGLTVLREGKASKTFNVTLVRDKIDVKDQAAKITYETRTRGEKKLTIGVIDLPSFYGGGEGGRSSIADIRTLLAEANKKKVDAIVLDLSRNGGGLLDDAVKISGLFLNKGGVVATKDPTGVQKVLSDEDPTVQFGGPLVILTSPASASASEILAGSLKDYHRAVIVGGEHTFGKGTVQTLAPLPKDLGAIKVTTAMFFLPSGTSNQQKGVTSDLSIPTIFDAYDVSEKTLDYSMVPQQAKPFISPDASGGWRPIDEATITVLSERSKARVEKSPAFAEIKKAAQEIEENKGLVRLSELRKKVKGESPKDEKDKSERLQKAGVDEAAEVAADLAERMTSPDVKAAKADPIGR